MKSIIRRWTLGGALAGCTMGLLFTILFHTGLDGWLGLLVVRLGFPVYWVVLHWNWGGAPEWLPWTVGVLFLGGISTMIGCALGTAVALLHKSIARLRQGKKAGI